MSEAEVAETGDEKEAREAREGREAKAKAVVDAEAKEKADLAAAKKAHKPIALDDARRGARVKLRAGDRADTTDLPIHGTAKGVFGRILADARGGVCNVQWETTNTWSAVELASLELVEEAPAATPAQQSARQEREAELEARIATLEARLSKLEG